MAKRRVSKDVDENDLIRLRDTAAGALNTPATLRLSPKLVLALTQELLRLREELFRIRVCETVDRIVEDELRPRKRGP